MKPATVPSSAAGLLDVARLVRDARGWKPATLSVLGYGVQNRRRNSTRGYTDRDHLVAAAAWLARAQDAQSDGGVSGRYFLRGEWTSSYPETTGYLVPTLLALESEAGLGGFKARAARCIEFLMGVQLESGAFPGMEIAANRETPSIFNSAQILNGLTAWHRATGDDTVLQSARRTADWLVDQQDQDGAWRRHLYSRSGKPYTYMAHAGCWIAEFGAYTGEQRYLDSARTHLEWVLPHVDESTGWIDGCGFEDPSGRRDAVTHTIAYTICGVLLMSQIVSNDRGIAVARRAARAIARRLELSRWLPGRLDSRWRSTDDHACLTGNAQMALIWLALDRMEGDPLLVNAACKAIDLVKQAQIMDTGNPNLHGGVPGSDPVWGGYIRLAVPNWAAKFFIDALLAKARAVAGFAPLPCRSVGGPAVVTSGVSLALPEGAPTPPSRRARIVLLADEYSAKVEQFLQSWSSWGFVPDAVVIRRAPGVPRVSRAARLVREHGLGHLARKIIGLKPHGPHREPRPATRQTSGAPVSRYCAERHIPTVIITSFESEADIARARALDADLFVYAGCGIMRDAVLALPRLGTVNVHMGLLPQMRGMNVAEWSVFTGAPVGCSVHLIDRGIDTGDILLFRPVAPDGASSIDSLRQQVDAAQIRALGEVVRWVREQNALPPRYAQREDEGRQYFAMQDDLRGVLQAALAEHARGERTLFAASSRQ